MTSIVDASQYLFTSESVTEGHPDKMCDQISDAILDAILRDDPNARVACETATTTGLVLVLGEITTNTYIDFQTIVRDTVRDIGYTKAEYGFDYQTCGTLVSVKGQSPDIAQGVNAALEVRVELEDFYLRTAALLVFRVHLPCAQPDQDREDENVRGRIQGNAQFRPVKPLILAPQANPSENERNQEHRREKTPRHDASGSIACEHTGNAVSRPGKENCTAQQKQG
jgi:hypothetical protein